MDEFKSRNYPIHEQMGFQRLTWVVERIGWLMLGAIALLALSGIFGTGLLSSRTISAGGLTVEYERFERNTKMTEFGFHFAAGDPGERKLHLNEPFREAYEIAGIQPQPLRAEAGADGMTLIFALPAGGGAVKMWAHPRRYGSLDLQARAGDGPPLAFNVFVYP